MQALGLPLPHAEEQKEIEPQPTCLSRSMLYSIACLPQAAGTFFQTPQACQAANAPCVVCGPFSQGSVRRVSWTEP